MNILAILLGSLLLTIVPSVSSAASGANAYPFTAGGARLSVHFGGATAFDRTYSIFGIGAGYYVSDGIELGLDAETWSGNSPRIEQVSPQVRAVLQRTGLVKPYLGAFYRRTFIQGYRDTNTAGARVGAYFLTGGNAYVGAGLAQEVHLNCDRTIYTSCSETYPELFFAFVF
jgi:hypothetical protein